tara:strand:+ start:235 stop:690 length:456 start_codon:yes stop_codon:yes gene_type:complete
MREPKDKRTKEWKDWKALQPKEITEVVGLGDVVEKIAKVTGIKKAVDVVSKVLDVDCGCGKKKIFLNKLPVFRKTQVLRCLNEEQIQDYKIFIEERKKGTWTIPQQQLLIDLYAQAFALQYNLSDLSGNCSGCAKVLQNIQDKLDSVYNER